MGDGVPTHVENEFRSYLKCGILAHGFARARCSGCGHESWVALACYSYCISSARSCCGCLISDLAIGVRILIQELVVFIDRVGEDL